MADFEHYSDTANRIALEVERKLVALNIDWHDDSAMQQLAAEALEYDKSRKFPGLEKSSAGQLAHMELCGLIALMHDTIAEGAIDGQEVHGSDAWKALARALWTVKDRGGKKS